MNNVTRILSNLDDRLNGTVELTLYGRAALQLGFADPPEDCLFSRDVDVVFHVGQAEELNEKSNFWQAIEDVNRALASQELYVSHFFVEDQVVLRPNWREHRARVQGDWRHLALYRLGNIDLLLSKLMRDDPVDQADALFIVKAARLTRADIAQALANARVPAVPEVKDQFERASARLLARLV